MRLRSRNEELKEELEEAEKKLGCSSAEFAAYRIQKSAVESDVSVLKAAMVRVS